MHGVGDRKFTFCTSVPFGNPCMLLLYLGFCLYLARMDRWPNIGSSCASNMSWGLQRWRPLIQNGSKDNQYGQQLANTYSMPFISISFLEGWVTWSKGHWKETGKKLVVLSCFTVYHLFGMSTFVILCQTFGRCFPGGSAAKKPRGQRVQHNTNLKHSDASLHMFVFFFGIAFGFV